VLAPPLALTALRPPEPSDATRRVDQEGDSSPGIAWKQDLNRSLALDGVVPAGCGRIAACSHFGTLVVVDGRGDTGFLLSARAVSPAGVIGQCRWLQREGLAQCPGMMMRPLPAT
jgi:hypothetical protein